MANRYAAKDSISVKVRNCLIARDAHPTFAKRRQRLVLNKPIKSFGMCKVPSYGWVVPNPGCANQGCARGWINTSWVLVYFLRGVKIVRIPVKLVIC